MIINSALSLTKVLMLLWKKHFENILGKGESAGNQLFFPFHTLFFCLVKEKPFICATFELLS